MDGPHFLCYTRPFLRSGTLWTWWQVTGGVIDDIEPPVLSMFLSFFASPKTSSPSFKIPLSFQKMSFSSLFLIIAACAIGLTSAAVTPHSLAGRSSRHNALQALQKRASGQFTFYAVGLGACGKQNTDDDFVSNSAFVCGVRR